MGEEIAVEAFIKKKQLKNLMDRDEKYLGRKEKVFRIWVIFFFIA